MLNLIVNTGNTILWSYILIALLIGVGLYFTFKTNFVQFRYIGEMFKVLGGSGAKKEGGVSAFQAFCISVASHVGTGNLAGVAIAVSVGGPGAVFWMWVIALVGGASSFIENTLAQAFKVKDKDGYRGGPAYYMQIALGKKKMAMAFSVLITVSFGLVINAVQANSISFAFEEAFGMSRVMVGFILSVLTSMVIFGGIKRIARVAEVLVPVMAVGYILVALFIVGKNISLLPQVITLIFQDAFGLKAAAGGGMGAVMMMGIKRGLFSNEAGMGSAPNAAATSEVSHPVKQGLLQTLGVFVDTILICSCTALVVLVSGANNAEGVTGIQITQTAFTSQVGSWGNLFIAVSIMLFAFSSIIGGYYYGESNIEFLEGSHHWLKGFRIAVILMVFWGCQTAVEVVWNMADLFIGLMALINLIAIAKLRHPAVALLADYRKQKAEGKDPVFVASSVKGFEKAEVWTEENAEQFREKQVELLNL